MEFSSREHKTPLVFSIIDNKEANMYFKRKIDTWLKEWKNKVNKYPALVVGIRRCGKTKSIIEFGKKYFENVLYINFWSNPDAIKDFDDDLNVDSLVSNLSLRFPNNKIVPGKTLIFFDEIQECPKARLAFKSFKIDGRYDVIGSGSFLGINGYVIGDYTPTPIGYEEVFQMKTMDFEEFAWAYGFDDKKMKCIEDSFNSLTPMPQNLHEIFKKLFKQYVLVGGFPEAVVKFMENRNLMESFRKTDEIIFDMKSDFGRRKGKEGNSLFKPNEVARIQNAFDLIPVFLSKENKRFIVSKILSGSSSDKNDAIEFLRQSHIVEKVFNLDSLSTPLLRNVRPSQFKLFASDISIVVNMYGIDCLKSIKNGELGFSKGALYEAIVFDSLYKAGIPVYYFAKDTGLEVDFVVSYNGNASLVEVKARNGNAKSSKTIMNHPEHYGSVKLIKIGDYSIGKNRFDFNDSTLYDLSSWKKKKFRERVYT